MKPYLNELRIGIMRRGAMESSTGLPVSINGHCAGGIGITPYGYGDACASDGHGCPIVLDFDDDGHLCLWVWADINQEDPTHRIDLEGALESKRLDKAVNHED